jgi:ABC-2 type transport system permease protein
MNALYVLWLRQVKKQIRSKARTVGSLGQPLLFLFAFGFGFSPIFAKAGDGNYITFLAPGVIGMAVIFSAMFSGIEVIWDRQFGFLKETLVAPVSRIYIALGRTLGGATIATVQGIAVLLISFFAGFRPVSYTSLPLAILMMFLIATSFTALGTSIATRMRDMQAFPIIMNFVMMPLFFLSGSLFPVQNVSGTMKLVMSCNPLTYGIDGLRGVLTGVHHFSLLVDFGCLALVVGVTLFLVASLFDSLEL